MKHRICTMLCVALCLALCACGGANPADKPERTENTGSEELQFKAPAEGTPIAILYTALGEIRIALYPQYAPMAVENFTGLAQQGYYNGLSFHRVVKDFVVQSGDNTGTGTGGTTIWNGTPFPVEITDKLHHYTGAVGMARPADNTNGNTSQFYIVQTPKDGVDKAAAQSLMDAGLRKEAAAAYREVGGAPFLDNQYTVFGQVYKGMYVVDKIAAVPCDENGQPKEAVLVDRVEISTYTAQAPEAAAPAASAASPSQAPAQASAPSISSPSSAAQPAA